METNYRKIKFGAGDSIERAIQDLARFKERGELVYGEFNGQKVYSDIDDLDSAFKKVTGKTKAEFDAEIRVPAINFTDFCKDASLKEIKKALEFYNEKFVAELVLEYFKNWTIVYDESRFRNGKILTNRHSTEGYENSITINDNAEYMINGHEKSWQYLPRTFSEFISDILRHEDFDLLLSQKGIERIYGK